MTAEKARSIPLGTSVVFAPIIASDARPIKGRLIDRVERDDGRVILVVLPEMGRVPRGRRSAVRGGVPLDCEKVETAY